MHESSFFRKFWGGAVSMPITSLFSVYLFWIKFWLSLRLRDWTLVHSLSLICYLGKAKAQSLKKLGIIWKKESELLKTWTKINRSFFSQRKDNPWRKVVLSSKMSHVSPFYVFLKLHQFQLLKAIYYCGKIKYLAKYITQYFSLGGHYSRN